MKIIAIEEHWNSAAIRDALDRLQGGARDESIAFNTMGDNQARLEDIGQGRIEAMDAAGIDVSILSVVTPATQALPAREAVALARDANHEAASAFATLPTGAAVYAVVREIRSAESGWVGSVRLSAVSKRICCSGRGRSSRHTRAAVAVSGWCWRLTRIMP